MGVSPANRWKGQFRSSQPDSNHIYCATKWCVFSHINVSKDVVRTQITERLTSLNADRIELLQFHWQDVTSPTSQRRQELQNLTSASMMMINISRQQSCSRRTHELTVSACAILIQSEWTRFWKTVSKLSQIKFR